ncbi:hypothetical protein JTB14_006804 [Gonioctena quinquepunctata]|nr:hypothetical protein JTB14_006804 [Gonioctena quinquepunctata]
MREVPIDVETRQLFSVGKQMCDNVEWNSGFTKVNFINNYRKSDASKLCIGIADSAPQVNVERDIGNWRKWSSRIPHIGIRPVVRQYIEEKLQEYIILPSASPFSAPVVLVKKKVKEGEEKKYRFCIDSRGLNAVTKRDFFSFPNIHETLDSSDIYSGCQQSILADRSGTYG